MESTQASVIVRVVGRVQSVGFRYWTQREAAALLLRGWVRNEPDGTVSAALAGSEQAVNEMLRRLHDGPPGAAVTSVTARPVDLDAGLAGFRILDAEG